MSRSTNLSKQMKEITRRREHQDRMDSLRNQVREIERKGEEQDRMLNLSHVSNFGLVFPQQSIAFQIPLQQFPNLNTNQNIINYINKNGISSHLIFTNAYFPNINEWKMYAGDINNLVFINSNNQLLRLIKSQSSQNWHEI